MPLGIREHRSRFPVDRQHPGVDGGAGGRQRFPVGSRWLLALRRFRQRQPADAGASANRARVRSRARRREDGPWRRPFPASSPTGSRAACTRASSLAANPFGCKHEARKQPSPLGRRDRRFAAAAAMKAGGRFGGWRWQKQPSRTRKPIPALRRHPDVCEDLRHANGSAQPRLQPRRYDSDRDGPGRCDHSCRA